MGIWRRIENFIYGRIIRNILFYSRLGRKSTFGYADSGINFDHIYRNKPKGYNRFGAIIDRILLDLPACRATRARFKTVKGILESEFEKNNQKEVKTKVVDLASGPARYLVDSIPEKSQSIEALCFDIDRRSLNFGERLVTGTKRILYHRANALFLGKHLKLLASKKKWKPNVVIASGFYEYQPDAIVREHFKKILEYLDDHGLFIGILQYLNPNRKLIEKLGRKKDGKSWVLYYRSPETLKAWMADAGYREIKVFADRWNHYVFCLGRKYAD